MNVSQAASAQPLEEVDPTGFILFHAIGSTENFTVTIFVYSNGNQNTDVLVFATPVALQPDAILYIRIFPTLQRAISPLLNVHGGFLV